MNTKLTLALLALVAVAQIAVPAGMALQQEASRHWGRQIKVAIRPVDPSQPFMGRYVALQFRDLDIKGGGNFSPGQTVYVELEEDANGFARAKTILATPPEKLPYLPARALEGYGGTTRIAYPFNRFYMREEAAPDVERLVAARRRNAAANSPDTKTNAYVTVRVWKGTATLEQLYIDNVPVEEYLHGQVAKETDKTSTS